MDQNRYTIPARRNVAVGAILYWLCGCAATISEGIQDNADGRMFRADFCNSVLTFVRSPLDSEGLRRAWFLPFGMSDEGFDFYAPMKSDPSDEAALAFYNQRVGQLTHYAEKPGFATAISKCFVSREGFSRKSFSLNRGQMRGSYWDDNLGRRVEIYAADDVAGILIADGSWKGDVEETLKYDSTDNVRE